MRKEKKKRKEKKEKKRKEKRSVPKKQTMTSLTQTKLQALKAQTETSDLESLLYCMLWQSLGRIHPWRDATIRTAADAK